MAGIPLYTLEQVDGNGLPCTNKCWNDPNMQLSIVWQYVILNLHPFVLYYTFVVENTIKDFLMARSCSVIKKIETSDGEQLHIIEYCYHQSNYL